MNNYDNISLNVLDNNTYYNKLNMTLSKNEINNLKYLNQKANLNKSLENTKSDFLNKSLREIIQLCAETNINIITDLINFMENINKYTPFFEDIDESKNILTGFYTITSDLIKILIKDQRSIYLGITLVLLSILLYFIGISS